MIRYIDVCAGISAASAAFAPLSWQAAAYSEIEPFPRAVLEQRWGAVPTDFDHRWAEGQNYAPLFGDFTQIEAHHVGPIDLLVGGTPCQDFSVAGLRAGLAGDRGNLTLEFLRLAERLRAPRILWENVPGVLSIDGGRAFGAFLGGLGQLGYRWAYRVLDAQFIRVDGFGRAVPQRRCRVFVVGYLGALGINPAPILFEPESLRGDAAPRRKAGESVAPTISARPSVGGGLGTDFDCDGGLITSQETASCLDSSYGRLHGCSGQDLNHGHGHLIAAFGGNNSSGPIDVATALSSHGGPHGRCDFESETFVAHSLRAEGFDASEDGAGRGTPLVPICFPWQQGATLGMSGALIKNQTMAVAYAIQAGATRENPESGPGGIGVRTDGAAYTLEARAEVPAVAYDLRGREHGAQFEGPHETANIRAASGGSSRSYVAEQWAVRRLTPTECERLMGKSDDFTNITWRGKPAPDGPRYKALGNSIAVNQLRWIARRMAAVEDALLQTEETLDA